MEFLDLFNYSNALLSISRVSITHSRVFLYFSVIILIMLILFFGFTYFTWLRIIDAYCNALYAYIICIKCITLTRNNALL